MCKQVDNNSSEDTLQSYKIIPINAKEMIDMSSALAMEKSQVIWAKPTMKLPKKSTENKSNNEYIKAWKELSDENKEILMKFSNYEIGD
jgi:hypothetical protein